MNKLMRQVARTRPDSNPDATSCSSKATISFAYTPNLFSKIYFSIYHKYHHSWGFGVLGFWGFEYKDF